MNRNATVAAGVLLVMTAGVAAAQSQGVPPSLSRSQRTALQAIVRAMDAESSVVDVADSEWPLHVLRASDGSHYVAFSAPAASGATANRPVVMYVRLATRRDPRVAFASERSAVGEWLAGQTPGPALNRRGIAFGEMPTFGAGAIAARGPGPQNLQLLELERERARQRREEEERQRKASLEGKGGVQALRPLLPFEDFDVRALAIVEASGRLRIRRSLTAGPGDFDLLVGWVDPDARDVGSAARVIRRRLTLPPASAEFALGSLILADSVGLREVPLPPAEQTARPYTIGPMDIAPAPDHLLSNDEGLAVVVQVINPQGTPTGKPDVVVGFRVFRDVGGKEEAVGTLAPQTYNDTTLPPDFDVGSRHPLFAAVAVPLQSFKRGDYRLEVAANDRVAGVGTTSSTYFTIVGTPAALMRDAPPLAQPFRREALLEPHLLGAILSNLAPPRPSPLMTAALDAARAGKFVDLIRDDAGTPDEVRARQALRLLALYAIGESASSLAVPLRQLAQQPGTPLAVQLIMGGVYALERNDRDAITAWSAALEAGADVSAVAPLLADAWLRVGDTGRALEIAQRAGQQSAPNLQRMAMAHLAAGRAAEALRAVDTWLTLHPDDPEAQWLALHALFTGFVSGNGPGADVVGRARIGELAARYVAAHGRYAALAREWAAAAK